MHYLITALGWPALFIIALFIIGIVPTLVRGIRAEIALYRRMQRYAPYRTDRW